MIDYLKTARYWLPTYLRQPVDPLPSGMKDVMVCVCDHFEPLHGANKPEARARLVRWKKKFPENIAPFKDADGIHPRHTLFYPVEQYDSDLLCEIEELVAASGAEVELHLHHDNENSERFRRHIVEGIENFRKHGFLSSDRSGKTRYGFVHGDWALDNSHPLGINCGVDDEIRLLRETGCYADFTLPSAPDAAQTSTINRIYYAMDSLRSKSHDTGVAARVMSDEPEPRAIDTPRFGDLLLVQGPLGLNWECRKFGFLPRVDNADLTKVNPPTESRLRLWLRLHIHVVGRPEWTFIKLHCHGAPPPNSEVFLGDPYRQFHEHLAAELTGAKNWRLHYVTARELVNIVHAAEDGHSGNAGEFRDYRYRLNNSKGEA